MLSYCIANFSPVLIVKVSLTKKCVLQVCAKFHSLLVPCLTYSGSHIPTTAGGFDLTNYGFTKLNYFTLNISPGLMDQCYFFLRLCRIWFVVVFMAISPLNIFCSDGFIYKGISKKLKHWNIYNRLNNSLAINAFL